MTYEFVRRTLNIPDDQKGRMTFNATDMIDALQQASDYWFHGEQVIDYHVDSNHVVTLLSPNPNGNVIGTLMYYG